MASNSKLPSLASKPRNKATRPLLLADFQRQALLDGANTSAYTEGSSAPLPTFAEEQEALRKETLNAFSVDIGEAGDDESGGLFVKKDVGGIDEDMEDEEYRAFLLGSGGGEAGIREALGLGAAGSEVKGKDQEDNQADQDDESEKGADDEETEAGEGEKKKRKRTKRKKKEIKPMTEEEKKQKDEEFLLEYVFIYSFYIVFPHGLAPSPSIVHEREPTAAHRRRLFGLTPFSYRSFRHVFTARSYPPLRYILNRGWIDRSAEHVPSYDEITAPKKAKKSKKKEDNSDLSADENGLDDVEDDGFDDKADEFETRYNFRFEEPYVPFP